MNTVLKFHIPATDGRSVADVLTPEIIVSSIAAAVEAYGSEAFAMAFTAFGEQSSVVEKLAA